MQVLLVRHGQSEANLANIYQGIGNAPLTELGREQAIRLQSTILDKFDQVFVSPLDRAKETARLALLKTHDENEFKIVDDLREVNIGKLEGISRESDNDWHREMVQKYRNDFDYRGHEGESKNDLAKRVGTAFDKIIEEMNSKNWDKIAIFAHGGSIQSLVKLYLKLDDAPDYLENCDSIRLERINGKWNVVA